VRPPLEKKPIEVWAELKKLPDWQFAAAKAHENWPQGFEVTEEEFDQAVQAACGIALR
jgi:hypothetical protein